MKTIETLPEKLLIELAYLARQERLVHPRGNFDNAQRFYPDEIEEGGTPAVRSPSRAWPYSYMLACRTRRWCAQLPASTRIQDARVALQAIADGKLQPSPRLVAVLA